MLYAFKVGMLAFDATRLCAADVDYPMDVLLYTRDSFEIVEKRYQKRGLRAISDLVAGAHAGIRARSALGMDRSRLPHMRIPLVHSTVSRAVCMEEYTSHQPGTISPPKTRRMPERAIRPENFRTGCRNPAVVNDYTCRKEDLA